MQVVVEVIAAYLFKLYAVAFVGFKITGLKSCGMRVLFAVAVANTARYVVDLTILTVELNILPYLDKQVGRLRTFIGQRNMVDGWQGGGRGSGRLRHRSTAFHIEHAGTAKHQHNEANE